LVGVRPTRRRDAKPSSRQRNDDRLAVSAPTSRSTMLRKLGGYGAAIAVTPYLLIKLAWTFGILLPMPAWASPAGGRSTPPPALGRLQQALLSCVNAPAQLAALAALTRPQDQVARMRDAYRERRDRLVALLELLGVPCHRPAVPSMPGWTWPTATSASRSPPAPPSVSPARAGSASPCRRDRRPARGRPPPGRVRPDLTSPQRAAATQTAPGPCLTSTAKPASIRWPVRIPGTLERFSPAVPGEDRRP
jgi:hypothetical protein